MIYEDGGPQFTVENISLAPWHRDKAIELLDDSYEDLIDYFTENPVSDGGSNFTDTAVPDGGRPTAYAWFETSGQDKQPIIDDLGMGKLYYLFKTEEDANRFMREYMKEYGVTDVSRYERVEVEITDIVDGEEALEFLPDPEPADDEEEEREKDPTDQIGLGDY